MCRCMRTPNSFIRTRYNFNNKKFDCVERLRGHRTSFAGRGQHVTMPGNILRCTGPPPNLKRLVVYPHFFAIVDEFLNCRAIELQQRRYRPRQHFIVGTAHTKMSEHNKMTARRGASIRGGRFGIQCRHTSKMQYGLGKHQIGNQSVDTSACYRVMTEGIVWELTWHKYAVLLQVARSKALHRHGRDRPA